MRVILLVILLMSGAAGAQDFFGDQGGLVKSDFIGRDMDAVGSILLDNTRSLPTRFYDPKSEVCYVNNCPQVHCSPCQTHSQDCRSINCIGVSVEMWTESC